MAANDRPFAEVLTSIVGNVQEIVRSEVRLAKAEVREEIGRATHGMAWVATGALTAFFSVGFALVAIFFALILVLPQWAAALIIAVALAGVSAIAFQVRATRHQENPTWAKHQTR
jgi:hypothetical protein